MRLTKPITAVAGLAAVFTAGCLPAESVPTAVLTPDPPIVEVPIYSGSVDTASIIGEYSTTITNNGGENSGSLSIDVSGPFGIDYTDCYEESLDPGDECVIYVYYTGLSPAEASAAFIDPTTIRDVGSLTVTGDNTPAPAFVKLIATERELQEL